MFRQLWETSLEKRRAIQKHREAGCTLHLFTVIFIRRDVTNCQIQLHPSQHYLAKLLLNAGSRVTLRMCLRVLQLLHLGGRQLYLAIPRLARANGSDISTVEFKISKVLDARRV